MRYITSIIYIYLLIIVALILLQLAYYIRGKIVNIRNKRKIVLYKKKIMDEMHFLKRKKVASNEHILFLQKELKKLNNLLVFEDVLLQFQEENFNVLEKYCMSISIAFQYLADYYRTKNSIAKAHFTYVLSLFPQVLQNNEDSISYAMMHFVLDKSIYCRENAMLFFYHRGLEKLVVNSLKKISKRNLYYSPRLLADDLLRFKGDCTKLSSLLLQHFDHFSTNIQVAIINYIQIRKEDRKIEIYQKFHNQKHNKEVELTMIRYFAHYKYEPMLSDLLQIINNEELYSYEYRLVAAYALSAYDVKPARMSLIKCLSDYNWYVRKNAAISLSRMVLTQDEINIIKSIEDPYANQMLHYIWHSNGTSLEKISNSTVELKWEKQKVGAN